MRYLPKSLIPQTLRARYIVIALALFVVLVFIAMFGWYSVKHGVHKHHRHMKILAEMEQVIHEFTAQYQGVKYATLEFLIQPDKKHYQVYQDNIKAFNQSFKALEEMQQTKTVMDFHEHYQRLQADNQQLQNELEKIIAVRLDAEKTFPFSTIMLSISQDNAEILSILNRALSANETVLSNNAKALLSDTRYTWVRLMAEYRLLVSVRFGIFTGDWDEAYKNRVYNIGLYIKNLNDYLQQLRKLQEEQKLPFETDNDVSILYNQVVKATQYYQYAIMLLGSPDWRQDLVLLSNKIHPAFARLDKSIHLLHIEEKRLQAVSMDQLTVIARHLSDSLWFLFVIGSILVLFGYIMFSRTILAPIINVSQALKDEATGGRMARLGHYSSAREICNLTDAFHEMRKQVKSRQQRLVNILDNAAEAIITIDDNGLIETFNAAAEKLFGYQAKEVLAKNVLMLIPENDRENYQRLFREYQHISRDDYTSDTDDEHEIDVLSKNQQLVPASVKISKPIIDGHTLYTALVIDISERLANEQERRQHMDGLAHAGRLSIMGEMAAGIAHELNQPLAAMSLYLHTSLRLCDPEAKTCKDIIKVVNSSIEQIDRASGIIRKMRGFAHRETFHLENADLNKLIRKSIDLVLISQQNATPQLELILAPSPLMVKVDALQIEQVLVNLIQNAFDAQLNVPASKRVLQIKSEIDAKGFARVCVIDAGEGVAKENVDKIFDTYFTTKADGLGMGLSICRSIIDTHNGVLWYRAREEKGSQFCFVLPLIKS